MIFNGPIRDLMPKLCRPFMLFNHDDDKNKHTHKSSLGQTIAVHHEDGVPWTHGIVVEQGSEDINRRLYKIRVTKSDIYITGTPQHMKHFSI